MCDEEYYSFNRFKKKRKEIKRLGEISSLRSNIAGGFYLSDRERHRHAPMIVRVRRDNRVRVRARRVFVCVCVCACIISLIIKPSTLLSEMIGFFKIELSLTG